MALDSAVGSFDITTGASDVVISTLSFQPKVIIFFWNGRTGSADAVGGADLHSGFGFTTGVSNNRSCAMNSDDGNTVQDANSVCADNACIVDIDFTPAIVGRASLKSFDSGGFTLQIDDAFPTNYRIGYMALGGSDLTDARVGSYNEPGATGNQSQSGFGFQPDIVCFIHAQESTAVNTPSAGGGLGMGWAKSSTNRWVWNGFSEHTGATSADTQTNCQAVEVINMQSSTAGLAVTGRAEFVSMDSGGFTINWLERISTRQCFYLAIRAPGCSFIGDFVTSVTLDADIVESGFGFQPNAVLCVSACKVATASNAAAADNELSIGAFTSTSNRLAFGHTDDDAAGTMVCGTAVEFDSVYVALTQVDATTVEGLVDVQSIDSDGFTLNQDDADAVAAFVGYVAFGTPAAPPPWDVSFGHTMMNLTGVGH